MTTPIYSMTPDFTPLMRMMQLQTRFALEASQGMMKLAMMPWTGMPAGFGSICTPMGGVTVAASVTTTEEAAPVEDVAETTVVKATAEPVTEPEVTVEETVAETVTDVADVAEPLAKPAPAPVAAPEKVETAPVAEPATPAAAPAPEAEVEAAPAMVKPAALKAPKGEADDLTVLNGVGPKLAEALNAEGIYHFSQIAAWTGENVAWVDENLAGVRGRASRNGWVAQAAELVK